MCPVDNLTYRQRGPPCQDGEAALCRSLLSVLPLAMALGVAVAAGQQPDSSEAERLVKQLASPRFAERPPSDSLVRHWPE